MDDTDNKSIPPEIMRDVAKESQIDRHYSDHEHLDDIDQNDVITHLDKNDTQLHHIDTDAHLHTQEEEMIEDNNATNQEQAEQEDDQQQVEEENNDDNNLEEKDETPNYTQEIDHETEMAKEGPNLAPSHLKKQSEDMQRSMMNSQNSSFHSNFDGNPLGDTRVSEIKDFHSREGSVSKLNALIDTPDKLQNPLLRCKFDKYLNERTELTLSITNGDSKYFITLSILPEFLPRMLSVNKLDIKSLNINDRDGSGDAIEQLLEYITKAATTELFVAKPDNSMLDSLTIFALVDRFLLTTEGQFELIDLEIDTSWQTSPNGRDKKEDDVEAKEEINDRDKEDGINDRVQTPLKEVRQNIEETIKHFQELLKGLSPNDPAAIAYQQIINTIKAKVSEITVNPPHPSPKGDLNDREEEQTIFQFDPKDIESYQNAGESPFVSKKDDFLASKSSTNPNVHQRTTTEAKPPPYKSITIC